VLVFKEHFSAFIFFLVNFSRLGASAQSPFIYCFAPANDGNIFFPGLHFTSFSSEAAIYIISRIFTQQPSKEINLVKAQQTEIYEGPCQR